MATETVTVEEHLQNFINKIATENNYEAFQTEITPVSSGGANYTSNLFKIKITQDNKDDLYLFAKVAALNEKIRDQQPFQPFDTERLFYNVLAKIYKKLEKNHNVSDGINVPVYYGAEATEGREILVMEDLCSRGFGSPNRFVSVDWSYAAAAITELAKFHALSMAFKNDNPHEYDNFLAPFPESYFGKNEFTDMLFNSPKASALATVRKENKEMLDAFLKVNCHVEGYNVLLRPLNGKVIVHGDFRPNNMLHKVLNDGTTQVYPVDYQTYVPGSPITDLLYFIFTASDRAFRAKYYDKLINHYYTELGAALQRFGLNVDNEYPRKDFDIDLKEKLPYGLLVSVMLLPVLVVPEDQAPEIGGDFTGFHNFTGELYSSRLNDVVDEYVAWGVLRDEN